MKNRKRLNRLLVFRNVIQVLFLGISLFYTTSCVQDDDYKLPDVSILEPSIPMDQLTTFNSIKSLYDQAVNNGNSTVSIGDESDLYIEGYVISNDRYGNFFEELIIQNKMDDSNPNNDPRMGFRLSINKSSLSDYYQFGQKVFVKLNGITVGETSGVLTLGKGDGVTVEQIQEAEFKNVIIRTNDIVEIQPKRATVETLNEWDENTLILLENMQLNRFELGRTFASESIDEFDGLRNLESCDSGVKIMLQTSTFSDFKTLVVPQGQGSITGIFGRDFRDDFNVLMLNSSEAVNFNSIERCDPVEFSCNETIDLGAKNLFLEDFESQKNNKPVIGNGWTNYAEAGSKVWEAYSSTSTNASLGRSARFKSASSGDDSNIGWLITPEINLDTQTGETLRFKTSNSLADSSYLEVLYSLDWDGTQSGVNSANWVVLSDAYIVKNSDSFVPWFNSGTISLSCISGNIHIAFKYTGSGFDTFDGVYELDEISIDYPE